MQDLLSMLNTIRRPRLLIRAARIGAQDYRRDRHLQRLLGYGGLPRPAAALMRLIELERELEVSRTRREVDRAALEMVRKEIAAEQEQTLALEESLRFYQGLMAPEDIARGLVLRPIELAQRFGLEAVEPAADFLGGLSDDALAELMAEMKAKNLVRASAGLFH